MANPTGRVVMDEVEERIAEERYVALEAELQAMYLHNEELMRGLQEQEEIVAVEWLQVDCRARA